MSDAADQVIGVSRARAGSTVTVSAAPAVPVRTVGDTARLTKGPPPGISPVGGGPLTAMRKTALPSLTYCARTLAGSQSSTGPFGSAARSRFHGLNAFTSSSLNSRDSVYAGGPTRLSLILSG